MFKFKGEVAIHILRQVDDIIGIAEAGFKSNQLNAYINFKTSDKELQFGPTKCKTMIVSKVKPHLFHKPELKIDSWELIHEKIEICLNILKVKLTLMKKHP